MRARIATVLLLLAISVVILVPNLPAGRVPSEDAGVFFYIARRVLEGAVPYRDVWDHKPPGIYAVDAAGLVLGGPLGVWIVQLLFLAVAALAGWRALAVFGERAALVGSIAWLVAAPRLFLADGTQTTFVELYGVPLQFASLALAAGELDRPGATWRSVAIGGLAGAAFLFKPTLVGSALAAAVVFALFQRRSAFARIGAIATGGGAVVAAACVPFIAAGAFGEMFDQVVRYNVVYAGFASPEDRVEAVLGGMRLTVPSGLCAIAIAAWVYALARRRTQPPILALALVALPIEIFLSSTGRGYHYYFLAWLPAMSVLVAFAAAEIERRLPARAAMAVLAIAVLAMSVRPVMLVARLVGERDDGLVRAAATYVEGATQPGEAVLVWGSRVEVLFLSDRVAPTRYVYQYAALDTRGYASAARVSDLLADLARRPPAIILDASRDSFATPPLDRAGFRGWTSPEPQYAPLPEIERIIEFVEARYTRSGVVPGTEWPVWRLRSP